MSPNSSNQGETRHGLGRAPSSAHQIDLALVIPAYNEQNRLPRTLDRLAEMADEADLRVEVLVVDDGSDDETAARVLGHPESSPGGNLSLALIHIKHRGKGAAVRAGMQKVSAPDSPNGSSPRVRAFPSPRSLGSSPEASRLASTRSIGSFDPVEKRLRLGPRVGSEWTAL